MPYILNRSFSLVSIHSAFVEERDVDFYFNGEVHDFWEIVYVASGQITVTEDNRVYNLEKGDIIFHRPMEFHKVWSRGTKMPCVYTMSFKTEGQVPSAIGDGIIHLNSTEVSSFLNIFSDANLLLHSQDTHEYIVEQRLSSNLESFIIYLACERTADTTLSQSVDALRYHTIINMMKKHLCEDLSVNDIARLSHMAPSTMKNSFSKFSDCGVRKHFIRMKILATIPLIKKGFPINEISEQFSFSSQNYFSIVFKSEIGESPTEYKKRRNLYNKTGLPKE